MEIARKRKQDKSKQKNGFKNSTPNVTTSNAQTSGYDETEGVSQFD